MAKQKKAIIITRSPAPRGAIPLGRVKPDLAIFVWNLPPDELKQVADLISKDIEMFYQMELLQRSGFGSN